MTDNPHSRANLHTIFLEAPDASKAVGRWIRPWMQDVGR